MILDLENASKEELKQCIIRQQSELLSSKSEVINYQSQVRDYESQVANCESEILKLKAQLSWFERQLFGRKSEREIPQDPKQMTLFDVPEEPPVESMSIKSYERTHRRNPTNTSEENTLRFDESVPVDEETILPEEVKGLSENEYEVISEKITDRLVQLPSQYRVKRTIRKTVKIKETQSLHTAPAPDSIIERSFADVSFLTGMIVDKFQYHLPLHRQHQRLESAGVHVSRGHLSKLTHRTLELLEPVYYAILSDVVSSEVVSMDETPIKAGRKTKGKMNTSWFWSVVGGSQVAFLYSSSRGKQVIVDALKYAPPNQEECRKLVSDGYSAYRTYAEQRGDDFIHAECWAHARRKFFEAKEYSPVECGEVLFRIAELFRIEEELKGKSLEEILSGRREHSYGVVSGIFEYLDKLWFEDMVDKNCPLGKAVSYTVKRKKELSQFLEHGDIPISNNHVERTIRPVAVGRKNWMFCWSEFGAKYAAIAYTLIESCRMNKVSPWEYIQDVLTRLDSQPAREVHLLTPKYWKKKTH